MLMVGWWLCQVDDWVSFGCLHWLDAFVHEVARICTCARIKSAAVQAMGLPMSMVIGWLVGLLEDCWQTGAGTESFSWLVGWLAGSLAAAR